MHCSKFTTFPPFPSFEWDVDIKYQPDILWSAWKEFMESRLLLTFSQYWSTRPTRTFTACRDHCFRTCPFVRPHFSISSKTKQRENNVRCWRDCGSGRVDHWWHLSCNLWRTVSALRQELTFHLHTPRFSLFVFHIKYLKADV